MARRSASALKCTSYSAAVYRGSEVAAGEGSGVEWFLLETTRPKEYLPAGASSSSSFARPVLAPCTALVHRWWRTTSRAAPAQRERAPFAAHPPLPRPLGRPLQFLISPITRARRASLPSQQTDRRLTQVTTTDTGITPHMPVQTDTPCGWGSTRATARFIHPHDDFARLGSQSPDPILLRESGFEYEHHS